MAWFLDILQQPNLLLVAVSFRHIPKHIMVTTQRHLLAQDQTISLESSQYHLHLHHHTRAAVLGYRDIREFHILSQH